MSGSFVGVDLGGTKVAAAALSDGQLSESVLRATDLTVEAIATRTGYRQPSFFIKQFRQAHAVTPAAWRRRSRVQCGNCVRRRRRPWRTW